MYEQRERLARALVGRYAIERELGVGGMATVYLARDVKHDRPVAIKVLKPELAASLGTDRFLTEIRVTANLQHPHILPLHDSGEADGLVFYVMPFVEGESLRDRLDREGQLPIDQCVRVLREVTDALARAHAAGVIHRDIKPDNVMLSGKHAVVTDFGVAKAVSASQGAEGGSATQLGTALGTPMYMAPEQAAGDPQTDHRADLYAVGVMAYEMLTGRLPFDAATPQAMLAAHVTQTPAPIRTRRQAVPSDLEAVVMRCLDKLPADRWSTAEELHQALEGLAVTGAGATPRYTSAVNMEAVVRHGSGTSVVTTMGVAALLVLGVVYGLTMQLGLPDWTLWGGWGLAGAVMALGVGSWWSMRRGGALTWRRARALLGSGAGLFVGAVIVYSAMRALGIGPVGTLVAAGRMDAQERVILARFDNATADSALAETLTELFRIDLAQSPTITVVEGPQIQAVLRRMQRDPGTPVTFDVATEIAEREGIKAIVAGEVRALGDELIVTARLVATATGETLAAGRETAGAATLIEAVDRLSASLRSRIGESLTTIRADAPLADVSTRSTEALRLYVAAERANDIGDGERAVDLLEDAIAEDSSFAMAYRKLAIVLSNRNVTPERARAAFTRAYELRDRLTDRERYLAEAAYFTYVDEDVEAAARTYVTLLERYPNDATALNNLGVNYNGRGRQQEAIALYQRAIRSGGSMAATYTNAIPLQFALGYSDSAEATLAAFREAYPDHPQLHRFGTALASARFDYPRAETLAREWYDAVRGRPSGEAGALVDLAQTAAIQGRLVESHRLFMQVYDLQAEHGLGFISQPRPVFEALLLGLAQLLSRGDPDGAVAIVDRMRREVRYDTLPASARMDLDLVPLYALAGRVEEARALAALAEADPSLADAEHERRSARAYVALAEGRYEDAIAGFRAARDVVRVCPICYLPELGEAYLRADRRDSAIATFEEYLHTPVLFRAQQSDGFNLWSVLVSLGEAYEAVGNTEGAVEVYGRFAEYWERADPDLQPMVEDMRGRIARLLRGPG